MMLCRTVVCRALAFAAVLWGLCNAASAQPPAGAAPTARCQVWQRELGFARSVAAHDGAAFREHLHAGAVFGASRSEQTRGPDAIAKRWAGIIEGKALTIEWYPVQTTESRNVPGIVWSAGPSLVIEQPGTAQARYSIGAYHSVWHRGEDGVWRVLYDDGVEARPASEAEVRAFRAARREPCPEPAVESARQAAE
jgi:ketosteroid isomerase-like protein